MGLIKGVKKPPFFLHFLVSFPLKHSSMYAGNHPRLAPPGFRLPGVPLPWSSSLFETTVFHTSLRRSFFVFPCLNIMGSYKSSQPLPRSCLPWSLRSSYSYHYVKQGRLCCIVFSSRLAVDPPGLHSARIG